MTGTKGLDYAWSHPGGAAIQRAGYEFACRYSSNDATKDISRQEADDLAAHGVWTVVVRETTANRARAGRAAGVADAKAAVARASTAGMPSGRPLYFAIDYDAPVADKAEICDYFRGVASVIGLARTGGYGGYDQLKWLIDAGLIRWVWQTAAWSGGRLLPGRHIYQYARTVTLNGVQCDINEALTADFGQWMPGKTPLTEDDMTPAQEAKLDKLIALAQGPGNQSYRNATADAASMKATGKHIPDVYGYITNTYAGVQQLLAKVGALNAALAALTAKGGLTAEEVTAAAEAGAQAALDRLANALGDDAA